MRSLSIHREGYVVTAEFQPNAGGFGWTAVVLHSGAVVDTWHGLMSFMQMDGRPPEETLQEILEARIDELPL